MDPSLGIVIPAFDPDVERLASYVGALAALEPETIRIELDDPTGTARSALQSLPATVDVANCRRGKGAAITAGFEALETDVYTFVDADGSTPVESLREILEPVERGAADLAVGSRRHPDAEVHVSQSRLRERLGDVFAWVARQSLPVSLHDYQCGAKAIDATAWGLVRDDLYEAGFGWDVDLVATAGLRGLHVAEVPIEWRDEPGSTVDPLSVVPSLAGTLLCVQRLRVLDSTRKRPLLERLAEYE